VILLDAQFAEVRNAMRGLRDAAGGAAIVVIGLRDTWSDVVQFAEWGAAGYVTCDTSLDELGDVLTDVTHGRLRCPPEVAGALMRRVGYFAARREGDGVAPSATLTPREREVLRHIEMGSSNKQIAAALGIETSTAKNHVHHVLTKLRARNRGHAAHQARVRESIPGESSADAALNTKGSASR
jgi:DNA-binding NarL/FixJ family response regulator